MAHSPPFIWTCLADATRVQRQPTSNTHCTHSPLHTHSSNSTMVTPSWCHLQPTPVSMSLFALLARSAVVLSTLVGLLCRQQRAALCIQHNWRRYQARKVYLLYRRRVVRLQCAWRSKLARRELRQRRASQREAGKLLQVSTVECLHISCISSRVSQSLLCWLMSINLIVFLVYHLVCINLL